MLPTIIVAAVIFAYVAFVIVRQVRKAKRGEAGCDCGCSGCSKETDCH